MKLDVIIGNIVCVIVLIVIFIFLVFLYVKIRATELNESSKEYRYGFSKTSAIPNRIFTYWNDPNNIPDTVKRCISSWQRHNPTYEIFLLTDENVDQYISFNRSELKHNDMIQRFADFVRIDVLAKYGGIWLDSTIYLNESLDWIHSYQRKFNSESVMYYIDLFTTDKRYPVLENWFITAVPGSRFIRDWRNEFFRINEYNTIQEYIDSLEKTTNLQKIEGKTYLTMHCSCQRVLQTGKYSISLLKAEAGPLFYNIVNHWWSFLLFTYPYITEFHKPVVKFRGGERKSLELFSKFGFLP